MVMDFHSVKCKKVGREGGIAKSCSLAGWQCLADLNTPSLAPSWPEIYVPVDLVA